MATLNPVPLPVQQENALSSSATLQSAASASGNGTAFTIDGHGTVAFTVSGTFSATITFQGSEDGTNYSNLLVTQLGTTTTAATTTTAGTFVASCAGLTKVRAVVTWTSGTSVTVTAHADPIGGSGSVAGAVGLIAGSAIVGKFGIDQTTPGTTNLVAANITEVGGSALALGQQAASAAIPVALANDVTATGNITTQNLNPNSGTATTGSVVTLALNNASSAMVQVTGTYTGVLTPQASVDGANWINVGSSIALVNVGSGGGSNIITSATVGIWQVVVAGYSYLRVSANAAVTGTAVVTVRASIGSALVTALVYVNGGALSVSGGVSGAPTTSASPAMTPSTKAGLTVANVKASAGNVYGINAYNPNATPVNIQFYNSASTPTLGTSVVWSVEIPATSAINMLDGMSAMANFSLGIGIGAATTPTGNTAPTTAPDVTLFYK